MLPFLKICHFLTADFKNISSYIPSPRRVLYIYSFFSEEHRATYRRFEKRKRAAPESHSKYSRRAAGTLIILLFSNESVDADGSARASRGQVAFVLSLLLHLVPASRACQSFFLSVLSLFSLFYPPFLFLYIHHLGSTSFSRAPFTSSSQLHFISKYRDLLAPFLGKQTARYVCVYLDEI